MKRFAELVDAELAYARNKYPERWSTPEHAVDVIAGELHDLRAAISGVGPHRETWMLAELASIACACQRAAEDLDLLRHAAGYVPPFTDKR